MRCVQRRGAENVRGRSERILATMLAGLVFLLGCPPGNPPLSPQAGFSETHMVATVPVPGGALVNVAGGNLLVPRVDLSIDTPIGPLEIAAVWNSTTRQWTFNFDDMRYLTGSLTDATGGTLAIGVLAPGSPLAGTHWVKVSETVVQTKGGLRYEFGADGHLRTIRWASSSHPRLDFDVAIGADGHPHTQSISQCLAGTGCEVVYAFSYDAHGRPVQVDDRAGRTATYSWEAAGKLVAARDGLDMTQGWPGTRYEYSPGGDLVAIVNSEGERVEYGISSKRVVEVRQIGPGTPSRSFHYQGKNDAGLFVTRYVDATGRETRFRYDANGQIHEMEAAATGDLLVRSWENRRMTSLTMPGGETTTWTYQLDDVATRIDPSGNVTTFEYDRSAVDRLQPLRTPLVSVVDGVGVVETRSYDPQGRLLTVTNGEGEMTTFSYGVDEALATQTLPNGVVIAFQGYGPHGRPTAVEIDGTSYPYAYDLVGNRLSGEAPLLGFEDGGVVAREYDADRNAVRIQVWDYFAGLAPTLPEPEAVEIAYRSDKRPLSIQRPGGADHGFQYDAFGREILRSEKVDGVWRATSLGYDAEGRPTSFLLANGMGRQITYDPAGRPYYVQVTRNGAHEGTLGFSYSTGRLTGLFDSTAGQETYQYDAAGRVAEAGFAQGERVVLEYDLRSRVVAEHLWMPGSVPLRSIHRSYDRVGRKTELRDGQTPLVLREFAGGSLLEEVFGNGLRRSYAYDAGAGFLDGTTMAGAGGQVVETTTMDHGWAGAMAYVRATTTTSVGAAATTFEGYWVGPVAASGSWTQGKRLAGIEPSPFPFATYDVLSNQVSDGATTLAYYNTEKNRLLSSSSWTGAASYTYDEAGFTTSRNGEPLTWTATGRLASLGSTLALSWDLLGRLVSTTVAGQTTRFLFGGRVEADEQGNPRAIELGSVRIGLDGSGRRYRHADFRDNVKFVTGDDGAVLTHYRYHPYGVTETFGSTADAIRFVGGRQVGDLVLLGARVLDPVVGRFLSQDPILNLINQYTYTLGNPIWFSDPTGLHPASSAQAIGFALTVEAGALTMMGVAAAGAPPLVVGIAAGVFLLGVISAGLLVFGGNAGTGEANEPSGSGSSGGGEGGGAGAGASVTTSTSSSAPVCTPSDLSRVPDVGWSLLILGPLQLMLGMAIVIRHRRRPRG